MLLSSGNLFFIATLTISSDLRYFFMGEVIASNFI